MATGIISIACFLLEMKTIALVLLVISVVAYATLWVLPTTAALVFLSRVKADINNHMRSPGFFTVVAGTCVLGSELLIVVGSISNCPGTMVCRPAALGCDHVHRSSRL
jgi:hypothetical protein